MRCIVNCAGLVYLYVNDSAVQWLPDETLQPGSHRLPILRQWLKLCFQALGRSAVRKATMLSGRFVNKEIASLLRSAKVDVEAVTHATHQY